MRDLVLHVGPHKTGTTSLQAFLAARFGEPGPGRDWYPPSGVKAAGHAPLAREILQLPLPPGAARTRAAGLADPAPSLERLRAEASAAGCRRLVLSAETFAQAQGQRLALLAEALHGWQVHLCFTLSPVPRRALSVWQQLVRGGDQRPLDDAWEHVLRAPTLAPDLVRRLLDALSPARCSVVLSDPAAPHQRLFADFCAAAGLDAGLEPEGARLNDSLGALELEVVRLFNGLAPLYALSDRPRRLLIEFLRSPRWREAVQGPRLRLPRERLPALLELARQTVADLEALRAAGRIELHGDLELLTQVPEVAPAAAAAGPAAP